MMQLTPRNFIALGDTLTQLHWLPDECIDMVVTSPPYWGLRNYGVEGQLGQERTYTEYLDKLIAIFAEVKRVLKPTGSVWVNLGDTYNTSKKGNTNGTHGSVKQKAGINDMQIDKKAQKGLPKSSLCCIPDRFKLRMVDELGLTCHNEIIWHKPNGMPQSVKKRFIVDYEKLFFFTKSERYFFDTQYEPLSEATLAELQKAYTGQATKDYAGAGAQNASDVKRRIVDGKIKAAIALGWQPDKETYADWYFNKREKKGWHDHKNDAEQGNGQQKRGHSQPALYHPLGRTPRSVWRIPVKPFKGAHFAVFPEALLEIPILSGCPEFICSNCGTPASQKYTQWRRNTRPGKDTGHGKSGTNSDPNKSLHNSDLSKYRQQIIRIPDGLSMACSCMADMRPGVVLDPFMGAGTTALVAKRLGRDWLGIELKREYVDMALKRIHGTV